MSLVRKRTHSKVYRYWTFEAIWVASDFARFGIKIPSETIHINTYLESVQCRGLKRFIVSIKQSLDPDIYRVKGLFHFSYGKSHKFVQQYFSTNWEPCRSSIFLRFLEVKELGVSVLFGDWSVFDLNSGVPLTIMTRNTATLETCPPPT